MKYKINYSTLKEQTKSLQQSGTEINIHAGYPKYSVLGAFSFFSTLSNDYSPTFKIQLYNLMSQNINFKRVLDAEEILKFYGYNNLVNSYHVEINNSPNFNGYIEELEAIYLFDFELQSILFKYLITIENFFKNMIGYHVSQKIGRTQKYYLNPNKYKNKRSIKRQINKIEKRLNEYKTYEKYPFNKYLNKDLIPATTYFSNITFG
ncbi:hypothetical protein BU107_10705, partial [Staphylococcus xylosus]|uniref:Abi family protein n=1 Tax=Staphylococcus xylosus TaxID=1288 RepID=UPI000FF7B1CB